jgi:hypothetical protein
MGDLPLLQIVPFKEDYSLAAVIAHNLRNINSGSRRHHYRALTLSGRKKVVPRKQGCPVPEYGLYQYMILLQNSPEI